MPEIPLTHTQAVALRADIAEINQLQLLRETKMLSHARHRDTVVIDGGFDPAVIESYEIKDVGGKQCLIATPKEKE